MDALIGMASAGDVGRMKTRLNASQEQPPETTILELFTVAVRGSHLGMIEFLLAQYPSVQLDEEVVRAAVNTGSVAVFKLLLGRDPTIVNMEFDRRGSPLIVACMGQQDIEYLRMLLEAGADPNQDPDGAAFPLALVAALYKDPDTINLLLQHGACLEHSGALAAAVQLGNETTLQHLLDYGARTDSDTPDLGLRTSASPLHVAVSKGHVGAARILLQHGANPHATDVSGLTAMELATQLSMKGRDMSEMLQALGDAS